MLAAGGGTLRVLHTPGHASNHVCLLLEQQGWLLTGDHLMSGSTVVILPPDGSMRLYLQSLVRLRTLPLAALLPGHGGAILDPPAEIDRVIAHRSKREDKVVAALRREGAASLDVLLPRVYDDTPVALHWLARFSLLAHLQKLVEEERADADGADVGMAGAVRPGRQSVPRLVGIEIHRASLRLGRHWALRDATFEVREGQHWLLFGANGAGKTVLLKLLRGDLWPTPTGRETRTYHFADGQVQQQPLEAHGRIAYLGPERQDRYDRYESTLTVAQVVLTGFDDSDFPLQPSTVGQRRRIDEVLRGVGLAGSPERPFRTLSYGQRRRVLLARALVRRA